MIEWALEERMLRVTDVDNAELSVRGGDLTVSGDGPDLSRAVDETVLAETTHLEFPHSVVYAFSTESNDRYELDPTGEPLTLEPGEYVVDVDTEIKTYLRFSGRATIEKTPDFESVVVSFPERTAVVLGFRSRHELPAGTITVPDDPAKVADGISHLAASHKTAGPDRTYPTLRGHPSLLEAGDELDIPDALSMDAPETGIELVVPPCYESLYVTAPLSYYLQATVRTTDQIPDAYDGDDPRAPVLRLPDEGVERPLSPLPTLERDIERLLRKTFFLDCLVRNAGPYGTKLAEETLLEELGCDATTLYEASPQTRLATYLDVPFTAIEHRVPEWHLSTYVAPEFDRLEALPFLLDRMSLIYRPRTSTLDGQELIERSLEDFYRGTNTTDDYVAADADRANAGEVASVDVVKPELRHGRVHGWLADGVPIDVFKSAPDAYYNRLDYLGRSSDATSIRVVLNDPEMGSEYDEVAPIYRQRSEELPIDVAVEESLEMADLARIFENDHDFVHYIGHCETDGFRCPDGYLSVSSLDRCNTQTFFLNACGSFYEGKRLIEKGSVAGAVTFSQVLNDHAVTVGSTFAKLLVHGFSIERAMGLARRRIMMGKDYAVVGDGTHSLTQADHRFPTTVTVDPLDGGSADLSGPVSTGSGDSADRYHVTVDCYMTRATGAYYYPHTEDNEYAYLCGNETNMTLSSSELVTLLKETEASVIYDGDLYWSEELWPRFERTR
ncbi:glycoside hydrolase family protein [Natronobacterium gregoryi]|uniref:Uncharacterized protein n=2 Tax=Natronobacterium gregoryi TaxID=44930 RepID=L0AMR1_NATGS|nr:hypothetical protein [Natronobacterium gregoryi]AFZ74749.1 hypothetical protein Natgr_3638 [Natronobacterium gregoryi SP2]ELY73443.1 hypothetical protein C490_01220 [Natronobacterium gregoryi SP2]PLK20991.1 hypothetical protein CYV19_06950 [Natronobacterium gregoryi SP2]SFJ03399.1 hypothetical protein SAMN05443661_1128 [Natronobacterium gregoryi]